MTTAIIAEDEPLLRKELRDALAVLWPELEILEETADGASSLRAIQKLKPDVAFLDINMPHLNGLEVAEAVRGQTAVVFLTAYNEHAITAIDLEVFGYLLKPLQRDRLLAIIKRLQVRGSTGIKFLPDIAFSHSNIDKEKPEPLKWMMIFNLNDNIKPMIMIDDVYYFQSDFKNTKVVTDKNVGFISMTIKELMGKIDQNYFVQIGRGIVVNLQRIESVFREDGRMNIKMKNGKGKFPVTDSYSQFFRNM